MGVDQKNGIASDTIFTAQRKCPCGNALPQYATKYCGPACVRAANAARVKRRRQASRKIRACICGRTLDSSYKKRCDDCRDIARREWQRVQSRRRMEQKPRDPCVCGKPRRPGKGTRYCSEACNQEFLRQQELQRRPLCACGQPLPPRKRKYCSDECKAEAGKDRVKAKTKAYTVWRVELARAYKADVQPERRDNHIYLLNCEVCDEPIEQLPLTARGYRPRNQRRCYCSDACQRVAQRDRNRDLEWDIRDWKVQEI